MICVVGNEQSKNYSEVLSQKIVAILNEILVFSRFFLLFLVLFEILLWGAVKENTEYFLGMMLCASRTLQ